MELICVLFIWNRGVPASSKCKANFLEKIPKQKRTCQLSKKQISTIFLPPKTIKRLQASWSIESAT